MKLLHVDSSIMGYRSTSRWLTSAIVAALNKNNLLTEVVYRDLAADPLDHLTGAEVAAFMGTDGLDDSTRKMARSNEQVLDEFLSCDVIVIGAPMYNFTLPTQLKAWFDRLGVAGKTFRYTATGAEGLIKGKRVIVASSRGGIYTEGSPVAFLDNQERYLLGMLGFIGITDVSFVRAEGLQISEEMRNAAVASALGEIDRLETQFRSV